MSMSVVIIMVDVLILVSIWQVLIVVSAPMDMLFNQTNVTVLKEEVKYTFIF